MLGINAKSEDVKKQIIELINKAGLPTCLIDYIMTEILNDVRIARVKSVQKEREAYQKEQEEQAQGQAQASDIPKPKTECKHFPTPENPMSKEGE